MSSRQTATEQEFPVRTRMRELAHREANDIDVSLFWRPDDNTLVLLLVEVPTGVMFEIPIPPENALDAFNHPYAYLRTHTADPFPELLAA